MPPKPKGFTSGLGTSHEDTDDYDENLVYGLPIFETKAQALALIANQEIRVGALIWKPTGLVVDGEVTQSDWEQTGKLLKQLDSSMQWLIGDLIVCGEYHKWGDQKQIAEAFGFEYATIRNFAYVCRKVEMSIRSDKLSFGHHQVIASLSPDEQAHWLEKANVNDWSIKRLSESLNRPEKSETLPKYLQPLKALRQAYNPKAWATMTNREKHRVFSELKGYLAYMADQLGESLEDE